MTIEQTYLLNALTLMNSASQEMQVYANILNASPVAPEAQAFHLWMLTLPTGDQEDAIYEVFSARYDQITPEDHTFYIQAADVVGIAEEVDGLCKRKKAPATPPAE